MPGGPVTGAITLTVAACVYALALAAVRRVDRSFPTADPSESTWWFGYSRDLVNLVAAALFTLGFALLGFARPLALLAGMGLALVSYALDYLYARRLALPRPALALGVTVIGIVAAVVALRHQAAIGLASLLDALFSSGCARTGPG